MLASQATGSMARIWFDLEEPQGITCPRAKEFKASVLFLKGWVCRSSGREWERCLQGYGLINGSAFRLGSGLILKASYRASLQEIMESEDFYPFLC